MFLIETNKANKLQYWASELIQWKFVTVFFVIVLKQGLSDPAPREFVA